MGITLFQIPESHDEELMVSRRAVITLAVKAPAIDGAIQTVADGEGLYEDGMPSLHFTYPRKSRETE